MLDKLTDICNEFNKQMSALYASGHLDYFLDLLLSDIIEDAQQQAIDDRETLSEMRALVYGYGW